MGGSRSNRIHRVACGADLGLGLLITMQSGSVLSMGFLYQIQFCLRRSHSASLLHAALGFLAFSRGDISLIFET